MGPSGDNQRTPAGAGTPAFEARLVEVEIALRQPREIAGDIGVANLLEMRAALDDDLDTPAAVEVLRELASAIIVNAAEGHDLRVAQGRLRALAAVNLHLMEAAPDLARRGAASKIDTRWSRIEALHDLGRATADAWLETHGSVVGRASTLTALPDAVAA